MENKTANIASETVIANVPFKSRFKAFLSNAKIWASKACVATEKGLRKSIQMTRRVCRNIVRSAVEFSIIAIAVIMIYEFMAAHPDIAQQFNDAWMYVVENTKSAIQNVLDVMIPF
jgi:hypothetical protein